MIPVGERGSAIVCPGTCGTEDLVFLVGRVKSATASPASEALRPRTCRIPVAWRAALCSHLGRFGQLIVAICFNAVLLLMPVHAADPPAPGRIRNRTRTGTAPHLGSWPYAWVEYFPRPRHA